MSKSETPRQVVQLTNGKGSTSSPFQVYITDGRITEQTVVRISNEKNLNPNTGKEDVRVKVSGDGIIVSHDLQWFTPISDGFVTKEGYGVIQPVEMPTTDEVFAKL